MTRTITVRLDEADHIALCKQAERLRVRTGTLARMSVHAGLSGNAPVQGRSEAHAAFERLVRRSHQHPAADAVALVNDAGTPPTRPTSAWPMPGPVTRDNAVDPRWRLGPQRRRPRVTRQARRLTRMT